MNLRPIRLRHRTTDPVEGARRRPLTAARRPALLLGVAATGALLVNVVGTVEPAAQVEVRSESVSIAEQLRVQEKSAPLFDDLGAAAVAPLEQLAASRAERDAAQTAAADVQAAADQAERDRLAAEEAARVEAERLAAEQAAAAAAAEAAARAAAEEAAAAEAAEQAAASAPAPQSSPRQSAPAPAAAAAPAGSYQDYAMGRLGGDSAQFSCLESLWGKESGWNPNAQNPRSTAYGIAQFLDSTWAGTGIAKTSDGHRQIDAGLIYIQKRYGTPCAAWNHSQRVNWY